MAKSHQERLTGEALRRARSEAGKKGAEARWGKNGKEPSEPMAHATPDQVKQRRPVKAIHVAHVPRPPRIESSYEIRNQAGEPPSLYIHGEIGGWGIDAEILIRELVDLDTDRLIVHLNSPGGSVFDGTALFNALVEHPAAVDVRIDGAALSIASVIAQAGDKVTIAKNASMMIHDAWMGTEGDERTHLASAAILSKLSDQIADVYAARSGKGSKKTWREAMRNETWFDAEEALEAGLVDEVAKLGRREGTTDQWAAYTDRYRYRYRSDAPAPIIPGPRTGTAKAHLISETGTSNPTVEYATVEILDKACPVHHTQTSDSPWDAGSHIGRLDSPLSVADAERVYGWYDSDAVEDGEMPKSACKLPHHEVQADGRPGPANLAGVRNALSRLPQSDIPESDHAAIQRHLQAHLDDAPEEEEDSAEADPDDVVVLETIPFDFAGTLRAAAEKADLPDVDYDPSIFRNAVEAAAENVPAFPDRKPDPDDGDDDLDAVAASIASLFAPPEQAEPFTDRFDVRRVRAVAEETSRAALPLTEPVEPELDPAVGDNVREMTDKLTGPKAEQVEPLADDWDVRRIRAAIEAAGALALPVADREAEDRIPDEVVAAAAEAYAALAAGKPKTPAAPISDGWDGRKIAAAIENAATVPALPATKPVNMITDSELSASFIDALVRAAPKTVGDK